MKLDDLTLDEDPEPTDEPTPASAKRKGWHTHKFQNRSAVVVAERLAERPEWMRDVSKLPKRPPGR